MNFNIILIKTSSRGDGWAVESTGIDMAGLLMKLITLGFDLKYTNNKNLWFEFNNQEDVKLFKKFAKKNVL